MKTSYIIKQKNYQTSSNMKQMEYKICLTIDFYAEIHDSSWHDCNIYIRCYYQENQSDEGIVIQAFDFDQICESTAL